MRAVVVALSVCVAGGVAAAQPATALPTGTASQIQEQFSESGRFTTRDLRLNGQGNRIVIADGGRVHGSLNVAHSCPGCGGSINQIIVGLAGEARAQACIWSGGATSNGWQGAQFVLQVPRRPGSYEVRLRYAQAYDCASALDWWQMDRPGGPDASSTIGLVTVAPTMGGRPTRAILEDMQRRLAWLDEQTPRLVEWASGPPRMVRPQLAALARDIQAQVQAVRAAQVELQQSLGRERWGRYPDPPSSGYQPPPPSSGPSALPPATGIGTTTIQPPPASTLMGPQPLQPSDFAQLLQTLRGESFETNRINLLNDALRSGARFTTQQALEVLAAFTFASNQVAVATAICPVIVEPGALARLTAALTFESNREELRRAASGRCGPTGY